MRVIAATNRDLKQAVKRGEMREDLYYRLAVLEVRLPPLRERRDDIPQLVEHFLGLLQPPHTLAQLPPYALSLLKAYEWPGNVRELRNVVERLAVTQRLDLHEEAAETLLPFAEKRSVSLETSGDITPAIGSRALLLQMTTNLVHNAIVHNLPDGGTVRVRTAALKGSAVLTVENTGETLDPRVVATLTEPFQRGTARVHTDHAGVGLGLAIVESIVRAHDGHLALTPRAGGGLRVVVRLPAAPPRSTR